MVLEVYIFLSIFEVIIKTNLKDYDLPYVFTLRNM